MKACPMCGPLGVPYWHFCRNVTFRANDKQNYFMFAGCIHSDRFFGDSKYQIVPQPERAAIEARWDSETDRLFAEYTARWTEPQRIAYRFRLWPPSPPPSELFSPHTSGSPKP